MTFGEGGPGDGELDFELEDIDNALEENAGRFAPKLGRTAIWLERESKRKVVRANVG